MPTASTTRAASSTRAAATPTARSRSRAAAQARADVLQQLKDDHKRVKKAYKEFEKAHEADDTERCAELVQQVLMELEVHATLEEELLYPAARNAIAEEDLVDEAEVEHESAKTLMAQLKTMSPDDEKYNARFIVLCEYVLHHVKEEEGEMFPQLEKAKLDWQSLSEQMMERRMELMPEAAQDGDAAMAADEGDTGDEDGDAEDDDVSNTATAESKTSGRGTAARKRAR